MSPWDSIGSYLEWGPSAHNGNANWATKCGKNSPRVKYVCTGKSPACQISLLYHSLFRFCCYTAGYLCFCGRLFMHCQLSRNSAKTSNMDRSLSLSSDITISLKVDLMMRLSSDAIGSWCRVGTGKMEGLARFPVTPKTDPCACLLLSLATLHNR